MHPIPSHILCLYPLYTQCDSSCLTLGTHWALGTHTGCTQQASILLSLAFLNITQDFKNLDSGQKKSTNFFADDKTKKPRNHETTKPQNHETYRYYTDLEMEWVKPCNRETVKLILISMTKSSEQNHGTTKPSNHKTMKPIVITMT